MLKKTCPRNHNACIHWEHRSSPEVCDTFIGPEEDFDVSEGLFEDVIIEILRAEHLQEVGVESVEVRLNGGPLHHQVGGQPAGVLLDVASQVVLELLAFGRHVDEAEVVEDEGHFVLDLV